VVDSLEATLDTAWIRRTRRAYGLLIGFGISTLVREPAIIILRSLSGSGWCRSLISVLSWAGRVEALLLGLGAIMLGRRARQAALPPSWATAGMLLRASALLLIGLVAASLTGVLDAVRSLVLVRQPAYFFFLQRGFSVVCSSLDGVILLLIAWLTRLIHLRCGLRDRPLLGFWVAAVIVRETVAPGLAAIAIEMFPPATGGWGPAWPPEAPLFAAYALTTVIDLAAALLGILVLRRTYRTLGRPAGAEGP